MKIRKVTINNRKKTFEIHTHRAVFEFPYAIVSPAPDPRDRIESVSVDPELGREGFTYVLESGREGSVHVDSVLEYNRDPAHMAELLLYDLTLEARRLLDASRLGKREIIRRLKTSPAQLYRLLDPTNYRKSLKQMVALLAVLGYRVSFEIARAKPAKRTTTR